jgi:hypothetical protein
MTQFTNTQYTFPTPYRETFACDYCCEQFDEDDLGQFEPNYWVCRSCYDWLDAERSKEEAELREMAEDDRAHAIAERMWENEL